MNLTANEAIQFLVGSGFIVQSGRCVAQNVFDKVPLVESGVRGRRTEAEMADVDVTFVRPVDNRKIAITLDNTITADEAINNLLEASIIPQSPHGYMLSVTELGEARMIDGTSTLADAGVRGGEVIRINLMTDAGAASSLR